MLKQKSLGLSGFLNVFYVEKKSYGEEWEVAIRAVLADGGGEGGGTNDNKNVWPSLRFFVPFCLLDSTRTVLLGS